MRILVDISHPKDANVFKNVIKNLHDKGHEIKIFTRPKENIRKILDEYDFDIEEGKHYRTIFGKAIGIFINDIKLYKIAKKFKPDIFVSPGSPYSAHVSRIVNKPHIAFIDTEIAALAIRLMKPFTDKICTPSCFYLDLGPKQIKFNSYYELAYLNPPYFSPEKEKLKKYGLNEPYIILRLSALSSHHDIHAKGFGFKNEKELQEFIDELEKLARVVILSEITSWQTIQNHQIELDSKDLHDILNFAKFYIGEGATMACEAGILGVPSIYVSNTRRGYLDELEEKYDLVYTISDRGNALKKLISLFHEEDLRVKWKYKKEKMLKEKIDTVDYIIQMIEKNS